jgi:hypothetical protein
VLAFASARDASAQFLSMVTDEDVRDAIELAPNLCFELPIRDVLDSEPVVN